ncbi:MAG: DUF2905 domain-containing protein [candidate division WOR-3 bacterium]
MSELPMLGRLLLIAGLFLILVGGALLILSRFGIPRLPGDILIQRRNLMIYIPVASALVLSLILTVLLNLLIRR